MTYRTFIAVVLAAALAVTGMTSTAARAGNDDVAKWIAGAVALGVIGAAISENNKRDRRRDQIVTRQYQNPNIYQHNRPKYGHGNVRQGKKHGHRGYRQALPRRCFVSMPTRQGTVRGFGRRCLLNNYSQFNALPHRCAQRVHGDRGRVIYGARCLRNQGYRMAGR